MKKLKFLLVIGVFCCTLISITNARAQTIDECQTEVFLGTVTYLPGETDPFEFECDGDFTDCTDVVITCTAL